MALRLEDCGAIRRTGEKHSSRRWRKLIVRHLRSLHAVSCSDAVGRHEGHVILRHCSKRSRNNRMLTRSVLSFLTIHSLGANPYDDHPAARACCDVVLYPPSVYGCVDQGAACMNNTFCLGVFMFLIYFRSLAWEFSAETVSILLVQVNLQWGSSCPRVEKSVASKVFDTVRAHLPAVLTLWPPDARCASE